MAKECGEYCECCRVQCSLCDKEFPDDRELVEKLVCMFGLEPDVRTFSAPSVCPKRPDRQRKCPHCTQVCRSLKGLKQHIGKVHDESQKDCECPLCKKTFKNKYAVKFHVRQVHEEATKVTCPLCPRTLYNKYSLEKHLIKMHSVKNS